MTRPDPALEEFVIRQGWGAGDRSLRWTPLAGGVSSDIWRVDTPRGAICIKRALPKLKVAADWYAPTSRNASEWDWLTFAARHVPDAVPEPLAHDAQAGLFAIAYLDEEHHPLWKTQLLQGRIESATAEATARVLATIHGASTRDPTVAARFDTTETFFALRLEPYLLATGARHPALREALHTLANRTAATRVALVHGDVSPKNILIGPRSPVLLDAECAWWGDPAFDIAFCLNHLLLKCLVNPGLTLQYLAAAQAFVAAYFAAADWESRSGLEGRAAALLPALMLARVDGKSPVEYLPGEKSKNLIRAYAAPLVLEPPQRIESVRVSWASTVGAAF